jgi:hypothetical protein
MTQAPCDRAEVTAMNTPHIFLSRRTRWTPSPTLIEGPSSLRFEVRPPSLRQAPVSLLSRIWFWLAAPAPQDSAPPSNRLPAVRDDFLAALFDVHSAAAGELLQRIRLARSLRELWHLRADVYRLVAVQHSQGEAEARLAGLNRHFPTRAPRSGFAPL